MLLPPARGPQGAAHTVSETKIAKGTATRKPVVQPEPIPQAMKAARPDSIATLTASYQPSAPRTTPGAKEATLSSTIAKKIFFAVFRPERLTGAEDAGAAGVEDMVESDQVLAGDGISLADS